MEDANVKLFFCNFFSISYISKLTLTNIGSDLVMTNTIFMAVMVSSFTFIQIYQQKTSFSLFYHAVSSSKRIKKKYKLIRFIGWYDFDCGKSNIKRHIPMCLGEKSVTRKFLQLLVRPHRSFSVVQRKYQPNCRLKSVSFTL